MSGSLFSRISGLETFVTSVRTFKTMNASVLPEDMWLLLGLV